MKEPARVLSLQEVLTLGRYGFGYLDYKDPTQLQLPLAFRSSWPEFYGASWRMWDKRPTKKQRESTPWEHKRICVGCFRRIAVPNRIESIFYPGTCNKTWYICDECLAELEDSRVRDYYKFEGRNDCGSNAD